MVDVGKVTFLIQKGFFGQVGRAYLVALASWLLAVY